MKHNNTPYSASVETVGSIQINKGLATEIDGRPGLYIQVFDFYGFQRELMIKRFRDEDRYQIHAYIHPGIRNIQYVDETTGAKIIERLRNIGAERLFGKGAKDFIVFHTLLFGPADPSVLIKSL